VKECLGLGCRRDGAERWIVVNKARDQTGERVLGYETGVRGCKKSKAVWLS
jgi:hypothetical protein